MKLFRGVTKVTLVLLALAAPALAAGPVIVENPIPPAVPIPAASGCLTFDVVATPEAGKPNGGDAILFATSAILAGPAFVTLTNVSTGKSINVNISGPTKVIFTTNTVVTVNLGLTLVFGNAPQYPPNLQGIALAHGRLMSTFDNSTGNLISATFTGTARNLCTLLE